MTPAVSLWKGQSYTVHSFFDLFPTLGRHLRDLEVGLLFSDENFICLYFFQVLKAEKEKQELQYQEQLSELMEKQSREVQDLG